LSREDLNAISSQYGGEGQAPQVVHKTRNDNISKRLLATAGGERTTARGKNVRDMSPNAWLEGNRSQLIDYDQLS
jgi:hypothetical protein